MFCIRYICQDPHTHDEDILRGILMSPMGQEGRLLQSMMMPQIPGAAAAGGANLRFPACYAFGLKRGFRPARWVSIETLTYTLV